MKKYSLVSVFLMQLIVLPFGFLACSSPSRPFSLSDSSPSEVLAKFANRSYVFSLQEAENIKSIANTKLSQSSISKPERIQWLEVQTKADSKIIEIKKQEEEAQKQALAAEKLKQLAALKAAEDATRREKALADAAEAERLKAEAEAARIKTEAAQERKKAQRESWRKSFITASKREALLQALQQASGDIINLFPQESYGELWSALYVSDSYEDEVVSSGSFSKTTAGETSSSSSFDYLRIARLSLAQQQQLAARLALLAVGAHSINASVTLKSLIEQQLPIVTAAVQTANVILQSIEREATARESTKVADKKREEKGVLRRIFSGWRQTSKYKKLAKVLKQASGDIYEKFPQKAYGQLLADLVSTDADETLSKAGSGGPSSSSSSGSDYSARLADLSLEEQTQLAARLALLDLKAGWGDQRFAEATAGGLIKAQQQLVRMAVRSAKSAKPAQSSVAVQANPRLRSATTQTDPHDFEYAESVQDGYKTRMQRLEAENLALREALARYEAPVAPGTADPEWLYMQRRVDALTIENASLHEQVDRLKEKIRLPVPSGPITPLFDPEMEAEFERLMAGFKEPAQEVASIPTPPLTPDPEFAWMQREVDRLKIKNIVLEKRCKELEAQIAKPTVPQQDDFLDLGASLESEFRQLMQEREKPEQVAVAVPHPDEEALRLAHEQLRAANNIIQLLSVEKRSKDEELARLVAQVTHLHEAIMAENPGDDESDDASSAVVSDTPRTWKQKIKAKLNSIFKQ